MKTPRPALIVCALLAATLLLFSWPDTRRAAAPRPAPLPRTGSSLVMVRRVMAKQEAVRQLLDGGLTLFQAAAVFRDLNAFPPELEDGSWRSLPGNSDGEKHCRQVIFWVKVELMAEVTPEGAAAFIAHLEAVLEHRLMARGDVRLEDPGDPAGLER